MNKPALTFSAAVLLVKDVSAAADYYREKLGFGCDDLFGEPPSFCILHRESCYLMLKQADDPKHIVPHWTVSGKLWNVYFWVTDANGLFREFRDRGAIVDYGLCNKPYGCREFGVRDLDGYDLGFGQHMPNHGLSSCLPFF